jgi:cytosine/adenosine deaminase-related metal-dependent hydrolase
MHWLLLHAWRGGGAKLCNYASALHVVALAPESNIWYGVGVH